MVGNKEFGFEVRKKGWLKKRLAMALFPLIDDQYEQIFSRAV